jgi:hypothetical protein
MTPPRTDSFVPLTAAQPSPEQREFRVTVTNGAKNGSHGHTFQTLESPMAAGGKKTCEPRVSVQRDGNRVTHLRVQCSCGQVLDLACVYDAPTPAA